jgi:hypothetical protein
MTTSYMGYIPFLFTHRAHACVYASAREIKRSLIYGRILFIFAVNTLHVTSSSRGYVVLKCSHRARACNAGVQAGAWLTFAYLWTVSLLICGEHTTNHNK